MHATSTGSGLGLLLLLLTSATGTAQSGGTLSYVNYEAPHCHPIRVSADGLRLLTVNSSEHMLGVWSLANPNSPVLLDEIPVGLLPVSVTERTPDEAWVVCNLSDAISVVSLSTGQVKATIHVGDEPADVVFAQGKAFVSVAAEDRVKVYDVQTHALLGTIDIFGKDPRALAVDDAGGRVFALVQRSGNGTTIVPESLAPPQPNPTNPALPAPPSVGLIVAADDPSWSHVVTYTLPDHDLVEIDATALTIRRTISGIGTNNFDVVLDQSGSTAFVTNTESRNLVRFEPNLRGHAIDSRLTRVHLGTAATVTPHDLNPSIDYSVLPNANGMATALAEPMALAFDEARGELYIAAHGTDRIGVVDLNGTVQARIDLQSNNATTDKRGPRGLALHPTGNQIYVYNRLSKTLSIVDRSTRQTIRELAMQTWDPEPDAVKVGRRFLYDSKLSGNGTMSCASCHIDGDIDGLAWDLGDPGGTVSTPPQGQTFPFNLGLAQFHPMKGPMTTQTLKGLQNVGPLHWRGDKQNFQAFNGAFDALMGGGQLGLADMNRFAAFGTSIRLPPNPNQLPDRSRRTAPNNNNEEAGFQTFTNSIQQVFFSGNLIPVTCNTCHSLPDTTNGFVVSGSAMGIPQDMKSAHLRNLYRKAGFDRTPGQAAKSGFGFTNDGALDTLDHFLQLPQFSTWPASKKDDLVSYLMAIDTGTAPLVGRQLVLDQTNQNDPQLDADLALMRQRATAGDLDLTAFGQVAGVPSGFLYDPATDSWLQDRQGSSLTLGQLKAQTVAQELTLTFLCVTPGEGQRIARDRDHDLRLDGLDRATHYGSPTPGSTTPLVSSNSEPRLGNTHFAILGSDLLPRNAAYVLFSTQRTSQTVLGATLLVDAFSGSSLGGSQFLLADARGEAQLPLPLPSIPSLSGLQLHFQFASFDPQSPGGFSGSDGLTATLTP
jgi:DNA-binding beta-propeller fold protein YncE